MSEAADKDEGHRLRPGATKTPKPGGAGLAGAHTDVPVTRLAQVYIAATANEHRAAVKANRTYHVLGRIAKGMETHPQAAAPRAAPTRRSRPRSGTILSQ
jgi:hypothetical protein